MLESRRTTAWLTRSCAAVAPSAAHPRAHAVDSDLMVPLAKSLAALIPFLSPDVMAASMSASRAEQTASTLALLPGARARVRRRDCRLARARVCFFPDMHRVCARLRARVSMGGVGVRVDVNVGVGARGCSQSSTTAEKFSHAKKDQMSETSRGANECLRGVTYAPNQRLFWQLETRCDEPRGPCRRHRCCGGSSRWQSTWLR
jgi:hypothetical protein